MDVRCSSVRKRALTEDMVRSVLAKFPNLHSQSYFVPPLRFLRTEHTRLERYSTPEHHVHVQTPTHWAAVVGQETEDVVTRCLQRVVDGAGEAMFVLVNYEYDDYLFHLPKVIENLPKDQDEHKSRQFQGESAESGKGETEGSKTTQKKKSKRLSTGKATEKKKKSQTCQLGTSEDGDKKLSALQNTPTNQQQQDVSKTPHKGQIKSPDFLSDSGTPSALHHIETHQKVEPGTNRAKEYTHHQDLNSRAQSTSGGDDSNRGIDKSKDGTTKGISSRENEESKDETKEDKSYTANDETKDETEPDRNSNVVNLQGPFPTTKDFADKSMWRGDFDVLVISPKYGFIVLEAKTVRGTTSEANSQNTRRMTDQNMQNNPNGDRKLTLDSAVLSTEVKDCSLTTREVENNTECDDQPGTFPTSEEQADGSSLHAENIQETPATDRDKTSGPCEVTASRFHPLQHCKLQSATKVDRLDVIQNPSAQNKSNIHHSLDPSSASGTSPPGKETYDLPPWPDPCSKDGPASLQEGIPTASTDYPTGDDENATEGILKRALLKGLQQLKKARRALQHLTSDLAVSIPVTTVLALPNTPREWVRKLLEDPEVMKECLDAFETSTTETALAYFLCYEEAAETSQITDALPRSHDDHNQSSSLLLDWWTTLTNHKVHAASATGSRSTVRGQDEERLKQTESTELSQETYVEIIARFCGCYSRLPEATVMDCINLTGVLFGRSILRQEQLDVLSNNDKLVFLTGPPGSGKTLVLGLKATEWARAGDTIIFVCAEKVNWGSLVAWTLYERVVENVRRYLALEARKDQPKKCFRRWKKKPKKEGACAKDLSNSSGADDVQNALKENGSHPTDVQGSPQGNGHQSSLQQPNDQPTGQEGDIKCAPQCMVSASEQEGIHTKPLGEGVLPAFQTKGSQLTSSKEDVKSGGDFHLPQPNGNSSLVCPGHDFQTAAQANNTQAEKKGLPAVQKPAWRDTPTNVFREYLSMDTDVKTFVEGLLNTHPDGNIRIIFDEFPQKATEDEQFSRLATCTGSLEEVVMMCKELKQHLATSGKVQAEKNLHSGSTKDCQPQTNRNYSSTSHCKCGPNSSPAELAQDLGPEQPVSYPHDLSQSIVPAKLTSSETRDYQRDGIRKSGLPAKVFFEKMDTHLFHLYRRLKSRSHQGKGGPPIMHSQTWRTSLDIIAARGGEIEKLKTEAENVILNYGDPDDKYVEGILEDINNKMLSALWFLFQAHNSLNFFLVDQFFAEIRKHSEASMDREISLWSTSVQSFCTPNGYKMKTLSECLRCPPAIQRLLAFIERDLPDAPKFNYTTRAAADNPPLPTDGPGVKWIDHAPHMTSVKEVIDCRECAEALADYLLLELRIGQEESPAKTRGKRGHTGTGTLHAHDVIISGSPIHQRDCVLIKELNARGIETTLENQELSSPPPYFGKALIIGGAIVQGLEGKILIYVPEINRVPQETCTDKHNSPLEAAVLEGSPETPGTELQLHTDSSCSLIADDAVKLQRLGAWNREYLWSVASRSLSHLIVFHV